MAPKYLTAKFGGKCRACGEGIKKGSEIVWQGKKRTWHRHCFDESPNQETPNIETQEQEDMSKRMVKVAVTGEGVAVCGHEHEDKGSALGCSKRCKSRVQKRFPEAEVTVGQTGEYDGYATVAERWSVNVDADEKPARKAKAPNGKADKLAALLDALGGGDEEEIERIARETAESVLESKLEELKLGHVVTKRIEFPEATIEPKEGEIQHPQFERLARYIAGGVTRIWITGEAGTGKTHAVEQIAESLERSLFTITPVVDKYELFGYCDANGSYVATQLYEWAVSDDPHAILLLDEIDGFQPAALVAANAALANGSAVFPKHGRVKIAPTKTVIATANTTGEGPTLKYSARMAQDGALMDRFEQFVHWGIHEPTERAIALQKAPFDSTGKAVDASVKVRRNLEKHGIDLDWGPRRTYSVAKAVACGDDIKNACVGAGLMKLDEHGRNRALEGVN